MEIYMQILWLFILAIPIACISWTVTFEEIFREPGEYFIKRSKEDKTLLIRNLLFLFTCEYCFSHYVVIVFLVITRYKLLYEDWRGYLLSLFALVWIANQYMSIYNRLRLDIKSEQIEIKTREEDVQQRKAA